MGNDRMEKVLSHYPQGANRFICIEILLHSLPQIIAMIN
jgi:hypothetical protein